jgi:hypothetical protein
MFTPNPDFFAPTGELTGAVTADATVLPAGSVPGLPDAFPLAGTLAVDDEIVSYTGIGFSPEDCLLGPSPCFTGVTRGQSGTAAAAHENGATIYQAFFTYTVAHNPESGPRVVGIHVTSVNDPPSTTDLADSLDADTFRTFVVTGADIDGDSGAYMNGDCELGFSVHTFPTHGVLGAVNNSTCTSEPPNTDVAPNADTASVTYTPDPGYFGADSFIIRVCDDDNCALSNVAVTIFEPTPTPTPAPTPEPTPTPPPVFERADLDCDGDIDAVDALVILRSIAGLDAMPAGANPDCPPLSEATPTPAPTAEPTAPPTPEPTPEATPEATPEPTAGPTIAPSESPALTPTPTATPPPA